MAASPHPPPVVGGGVVATAAALGSRHRVARDTLVEAVYELQRASDDFSRAMRALAASPSQSVPRSVRALRDQSDGLVLAARSSVAAAARVSALSSMVAALLRRSLGYHAALCGPWASGVALAGEPLELTLVGRVPLVGSMSGGAEAAAAALAAAADAEGGASGSASASGGGSGSGSGQALASGLGVASMDEADGLPPALAGRGAAWGASRDRHWFVGVSEALFRAAEAKIDVAWALPPPDDALWYSGEGVSAWATAVDRLWPVGQVVRTSDAVPTGIRALAESIRSTYAWGSAGADADASASVLALATAAGAVSRAVRAPDAQTSTDGSAAAAAAAGAARMPLPTTPLLQALSWAAGGTWTEAQGA
jgi:hypothetical protein